MTEKKSAAGITGHRQCAR